MIFTHAMLASAVSAVAETLITLPDGAVLTHETVEAGGQYTIPIGPWSEGAMPAEDVEGAVTRRAWRLDGNDAATGVLRTILADQINAAGFTEVFTCTDRTCGGFDFRYTLDIAPEPDMHVNLADFEFYAAERFGVDGLEWVALVVSRGGGAGFVHLVHVGPPGQLPPDVTLSSRGSAETEIADAPDAAMADFLPSPDEMDDLVAMLTNRGHAPLVGLAFETGSATLGTADRGVLEVLAQYLQDNPATRIALVGHTDAEGALSGNITLSRARANSVRRVLIEDYGIAANRLEAEGVGYLAPMAPNSTDAGREINRRVEAVLLNTE